MKKKVSFSINQCDNSGEIFDKCILVYIDDNTIIRFDDLNQLIDFRNQLDICMNEINLNLKVIR